MQDSDSQVWSEKKRPRGMSLPADPSDDELAREWTLSSDDLMQVRQCRGATNRIRFAVQLCVLRKYSRFLENYSDVTTRILNHFCRQLKLSPAHVVLQRLTNASPQDRLAKAVNALGRIVKTIFILKYITDPALRSKIQRQLNRGESRHDLVKALCFANQGELKTGDYDQIMNKASCQGKPTTRKSPQGEMNK